MECQHDSHPEFHGQECACSGCYLTCPLDDPCDVCLGPHPSQCVILFRDGVGEEEFDESEKAHSH